MQRITEFTKKHILLLSLIYTLGLLTLNIVRLFDRNFWYDEAFSLCLIREPLPGVIYGTAVDVHPPFYYIILWIASRIFGMHPIVYRLVSFAALLGVVAIAFTWVRKKFSINATLLLVTFACALETSLVYNVEVRMYSWGELLMLLTFMAFYEILHSDKTAYYVMFSIVSLCAAYTHYYMLIGVAVFYLLLLVLALRKKGISLKKVLVIYGVAVAVYLPWLLVLVKTLGRTSNGFWIGRVAFIIESFAYIFTDAEKNNPLGYILGAFLYPLMVGIILYKFNILTLEKKENGKKRLVLYTGNIKYSKEAIWLLSGLLCIFGTALAGFVISIAVRPLYITRYVFPMAVIGWLLAGICVSKLKKKNLVTALIILVVLAVNIPIFAVNYKAESETNQRCIETHEATVDMIGEGDIAFVEDILLHYKVEPAFEGTLSYYYPGVFPTQALPDNETSDDTAKLSWLLDDYGKPEGDREYYLFLTNRINERYTNILTEKGYTWETVYLDGNIGTYQVNIYRLVPAD